MLLTAIVVVVVVVVVIGGSSGGGGDDSGFTRLRGYYFWDFVEKSNQVRNGNNNIGQGFFKIFLLIVRGHGWIDRDECFWNCKGKKENVWPSNLFCLTI